MHRIDHATATVDNLFTEGDPVGGVAATVMTDDWANAIQEEICAVLAAAGITLDKANNAQLLAALVALGVRAATTALTGVVELATTAETVAGTDADRAVTPAGLAGFAKSLAANGYAKLPGGLILQWGMNNSSPAGETVTFPLAWPNAFLCGAGIDNSSIPYAHSMASVTSTQFVFYTSHTVAESSYWVGIGY